jgi:hypothetical protein
MTIIDDKAPLGYVLKSFCVYFTELYSVNFFVDEFKPTQA